MLRSARLALESAFVAGSATIAFETTARARTVVDTLASSICGDGTSLAWLGHCPACWVNGTAAALAAWTLVLALRRVHQASAAR